MTRTPTAPAPLTLFELRRYRTRPGRRDELLALFETHFRPAYEAAGATILASWTVADDPDRWVWIRAFTGAVARRQALKAFYGGTVWARWGAACNATLADASDARVLQALDAPGLAHPPLRAALPDAPLRPWLASLGTAEQTAAEARAHPAPPALVLGHARGQVLLRRFDTPAAEAAFHAGAAARGLRHWRLLATPCSRLR